MNSETLGGLLHDGTYRARWLREVLRTPQVTDSVRVLLITLALYMDATGRVSVPREDLAGLLGRNTRKVADKVKIAMDSGFLIQTARGQKHQTAVYQAAISGQPLSVPPGGHAEEPGASDFRMTPGGQADDSQGAGFKHPEPDSQGAGFKHPEAQGADLRVIPGGHAENSQDDPRGAPHSYKRVDVGDDVDLSNDEGLFDLKRSASRRPPAAQPKTRRRAESAPPDAAGITAQALVAEWIDACVRRPPGDVIGQVSSRVKKMLGEDIDPGFIRDGLELWAAKGLHPSALPSVVNEVMNKPAMPAVPPRTVRSTTDERVAAAQALKARFASHQPPTIAGEIAR